MRSAEGQSLVQKLIAAAGVFITNVAGRQWHSYPVLRALRPDLIQVEVAGRGDGGTGVDYTINAATGFPLVTGPADHVGPINHVLPAWDVSCGLYAVVSVLSALRHRDQTGAGSEIRLPLEDVALATTANLGFLTEVMVTGVQRPRLGNAIFGQYGCDFITHDGVSFMVVALTTRHFRDLVALTGTADAVAALESSLPADLEDEGARYEHRHALNAVFAPWFAAHTAAEVSTALAASSVLWERYQDFAEVAASPRVTANPLFSMLEQPRIGSYPAPGLPMSFDGVHSVPAAAPALGQDNDTLPSEWLGE